ncbi:O-antigen ligase family protein [Natronococcus sp. A-GB1]|uniref:O-antigen ligase family protein n=1 Tax=Natronococcus sp. A-GB1 TaxID=3037648 RepID=UPI00241FC9EA|nr:O-antigen ligase family protein [Natronococcus sp. A-GB1]MDG5760329.1 O-antigen ligase family protein [Natronococcus sp. A-GB1]
MGTVTRSPGTSQGRHWSVSRLVAGVIYGLFGLYLGLVTVAYATDLVFAWQLAAVAVLLAAVLGVRLAIDRYRDSEHRQAALLSVLGFALAVFAMIYQSSSPGLGLGPSRPLALTVVFVLFLSFLLAVTGPRRYTPVQWAAIGCFMTLSMLYLVHTLAFDPSSSQSRWPIWALFVMGTNLLVVPRLVPDRVFFWLLSSLGSLAVLLGLATYGVGEYAIWIFEVRQWSSTPPVPGVDTTLQSVFPNPNGFGLLSFAGFVAAVVEFHRSLVARRPLGAGLAIVAGSLCGLGVLLSNARASILAAMVVVVVYAGYVLGGRRLGALTLASTVFGVVAVLAGMAVGLIDISSANRFELWSASLQAIRDGPLLVGHGGGPASVVIEPYLATETAPSPHNSYLSVVIQTGLVGGLAYVGLLGGSIVAGMVDTGELDAAMLAFVTGWAIHQLFESYTMFHWSLGSVVVTLSVGYLLFGERAS